MLFQGLEIVQLVMVVKLVSRDDSAACNIMLAQDSTRLSAMQGVVGTRLGAMQCRL